MVSEKFMPGLELDGERGDVNGGAMALGHPIGATGATGSGRCSASSSVAAN